MSIDEALDHVRQTVPHCDLAGYIDIEAELVLAKSTARPVRQERLDALAALAGLLLGDGDAQDGTQAMIALGDRLVFFLRLPEDPSAVCFGDCRGGAEPDAVFSAAQEAMTRVQQAL
ncbi:MAG: hypothetical protein AAF748_08425 [Pseudomonadota bacterium]